MRTADPSRTMPTLFIGVAVMNAAMASTSTVSTIAAADRFDPQWSGLPNTAGIVGTGIGALALSRVMSRRGRRAGLVLGYLAAMAGAVIGAAGPGTAGAAGAATAAVCLSGGMLLLGMGNAGAQLSRYVATELYPARKHGFAIGTVVWAGALGAVGGPLLLAPSARLATALGSAPLTGPFLLGLVTAGVAALASLGAPIRRAQAGAESAPLRELMRGPTTRTALAVMATGQLAMVMLMTATPLDMHLHGHGLGAVGAALSAHTLGMFALSPVTGRLVDRLGPRPVMLAGLSTLVAAAGLVAASDEPAPRTAGLFLLGYGWNLCFIGGTGQLTRGLVAAERLRVEGTVDAAVWGVAAAGSLAATAMYERGGFPVLAMMTALLVLLTGLATRAGVAQPDAAELERTGDDRVPERPQVLQ